MGWFGRKGKTSKGNDDGKPNPADVDHLRQFVQSRRGVEAYVEPRTNVTPPTVVLVAHDGEWTRRRIGSPRHAHKFAVQMGIPVYDANIVGYPQRMRAYKRG